MDAWMPKEEVLEVLAWLIPAMISRLKESDGFLGLMTTLTPLEIALVRLFPSLARLTFSVARLAIISTKSFATLTKLIVTPSIIGQFLTTIA